MRYAAFPTHYLSSQYLLLTHYHYIISGSGCAGLSLLLRLLKSPVLEHKNILVLDAQLKNVNDRTWCFWEKEEGLFQPIVYKQWQEVRFAGPGIDQTLNLAPYSYKMIRGIDFYYHVLKAVSAYSNVHFLQASVYSVHANGEVRTDKGIFTADYIFNSIVFDKPVLQPKQYYLMQHFKGWKIQTGQPAFDAAKATFMDFTITQQYGTAFMYLLPVSETEALVEFTLFTDQLLQQEQYNEQLRHYITQRLGITQYTIAEEEFGVIPMTNHVFSRGEGKLINIGSAGGDTKGSTGYSFQFIQKRTAQIVKALSNGKHPLNHYSYKERRFIWYDGVLLNVLANHKLPGDQVFARMFKRNPVQNIFRFLDNESNLLQDLALISRMPQQIFFRAAMQQL